MRDYQWFYSKLLVVGYASDLGATPQHQIDEIRKAFNIPTDQTIIGYIGRLSEQKGMIPFIKALKDYKHQFENCKFLIVGSGEQEDEIKNLIKEIGLEELFIFTGFQSNVYPFYQLIDIFFLPSLYEGLPMVLLEAVGSGVPTISMNVGSISEVIINGNNGILVEPRDYDTFIVKLLQLKQDKNYREELSQNGVNYVVNNYSIQTYNDSLKEIYKSIYENKDRKDIYSKC